jgi:serine/threonine protein kinase
MPQEAQRVGRYEVLEHLASGGMGEVYLARSSGLAGFERHVVLKMLNVDDDNEQFVSMFLDEARVVGRMHHQHIAPAYDLDRDAEGRYFLVMDYVHGQTAKAVWRRSCETKAPLPLDFTVTVIAAAAAALHYAHTLTSRDGEPLEIVHRDVSLSNLMIGYDGAVKLIDFGIAKAARRSSLTQVGYVKGKVAYMAPEQIDGLEVDRRTDIFALGIVLYELATMKRAFREANDGATVERIRRGQIVPPPRIVPGFPNELHYIISKALAVDPAARFQDADAMRRALEAFGRIRKLVIGDAAVVGIMERLFESRAEPWQASPSAGRRSSSAIGADTHDDASAWRDRATSELAIPFSPVSAEEIATRPVVTPRSSSTMAVAAPAEIHDLPTAKLADHHHRFEDDPVTHPLATAILLSSTELVTDPFAIPLVIARSNPMPVDSVLADLTAPTSGREPDLKPSWSHTAILPSQPKLSSAVTWLVPIALVGAGIMLVNTISLGAKAPTATEPRLAPTPRASAPIITPLLPEPPAATPAGATIHLHVTTTPDDATVLLDGQRLGHTPFDGTVAKAPGMHVLKIRRRGCVPKLLDVELSSDIARDLPLQPLTDPTP